jgi:low affinity Fe/Cu permease
VTTVEAKLDESIRDMRMVRADVAAIRHEQQRQAKRLALVESDPPQNGEAA